MPNPSTKYLSTGSKNSEIASSYNFVNSAFVNPVSPNTVSGLTFVQPTIPTVLLGSYPKALMYTSDTSSIFRINPKLLKPFTFL